MNFWKIVKTSLRYRWSIVLSILTAMGVSVLWGANLSAVYPFMEITFKGQTLQQWIDNTIAQSESQIATFQRDYDAISTQPDRENDAALLQRKLRTEETALYGYRLTQRFVCRFVPNDAFATIALLLAVLLSLTALKIAFLIANTLFVTRVVNRTIYDVRNQLFDKCLELDMARYNNRSSAELMSRITNDVGGIATGISYLYGKLIREPLKMFVCLGLAIWINWQLFVVTAMILPPIAWIISKLAQKIKKVSRQIMAEVARLFEKMQETFYGIKIVKCFTMEEHMRDLFQKQGLVLYRKSYTIAFLDVFAKCVVEFSGILIVSIALLVGAWLVLSGGTTLFGIPMAERPLTIEWLVMFYVALLGAADPARKLSDIFTSMQNAVASADRIYELLDAPVAVRDPEHPKTLENPRPDLVFSNVSFDYQPDRPVLRGIQLTLKFGQTYAIVGPNGCGKSTLLNLIPRLADPTSGTISLGGIPLPEMTQHDLHTCIGLVSQDAILFDDTVRNNIRFGRPSATDEEVIAAAKKAFADPFIQSVLPQGYDTPLGPHGGLLSGGQKQRIALARVILREPKLLLLDEATSQIDLESERDIQEAIAMFRNNRTTLFVTHRVSMLALADTIIVMDSGRITDLGTHAELLQRNPFYKGLYTN
ncbi:MAG: ABC transporter ATP-binding protein [Planctomycetia bacterium]|nr:ABC transporter ATP-binding protein [Planctomycetia bacterium]